MTKQELDKITRHESTWEEFTAIERIYMMRDDMTKEEAAQFWKKCFFTAAAKREAEKAELHIKDAFRVFLATELRRGWTKATFEAKNKIFLDDGRIYEFLRSYDTVHLRVITDIDIRSNTETAEEYEFDFNWNGDVNNLRRVA